MILASDPDVSEVKIACCLLPGVSSYSGVSAVGICQRATPRKPAFYLHTLAGGATRAESSWEIRARPAVMSNGTINGQMVVSDE